MSPELMAKKNPARYHVSTVREQRDEVTATLAGAHTRLLNGSVIGQGLASNAQRILMVTTLSLPGISARTCKAAIEGVVAPIAGVGAVDVNVTTKTITIHHDNRAPARRLIEAVEEQGYHVADPWMSGRDAARAGLGFIDGDGI